LLPGEAHEHAVCRAPTIVDRRGFARGFAQRMVQLDVHGVQRIVQLDIHGAEDAP
jgi:hypothetical protein